MGVLVGLWNGTWVARLGVPAFVATLGGMLAFRGASLAVSGVEPSPAYATRSACRKPSLPGQHCGRSLLAAAVALLPLRHFGNPSRQKHAMVSAFAGRRRVDTRLDNAVLSRPADAGGNNPRDRDDHVLVVAKSRLGPTRLCHRRQSRRSASRGHQCWPSNHGWHVMAFDGGGRRPLRRPARCCSARNRLFSRAQRDIGGGDWGQPSMAAAAPYQAFSWARC